MTTFLRLVDVATDEKAAVLRDAVHRELPMRVFEIDPRLFAQVPGSPYAYWLSDRVRRIFVDLPKFESDNRTAKHGAATLDDTRYLRASWEVSLGKGRWVPFAKGGAPQPFLASIPLVLNWGDDGNDVKAFVAAKVGSASRTIQATEYYFRAGITWPLRASRFAPQALPRGCIFSARGYCAFVPDDELPQTLAVFSSSAFDYLFKTMLGRYGHPEFIVGILQALPWLPAGNTQTYNTLAELGRRAWSLRYTLHSARETSPAFSLPSAFRSRTNGPTFPSVDVELNSIQASINDLTFNLYGIEGQDRIEIEYSVNQSAKSQGANDEAVSDSDAEGRGGETDEEEPEGQAGDERDALLSWLVGVAFGRFDPRLAAGKRPIPPEPEPFDPLPARSPGMWPEGEPRDVEPPVLLVDDPGHAEDISTHLLRVAGEVDCHVPEDLRSWLAREFFPLHIRMYSKSRRKAPIYWQLATASASYSIWLYIHAFTKDTFYKVQNDYAAPKLEHEIRRLENLRRELGETPRPADRKILAAQETFVEELSAFLEEVKRITPLWNPDLDDGVLINFAPLHRLVPHHKPWQKELKATWDSLCDGEYDWAHLAMHLWPERVVPKCATDRSLAIAHGLEDAFWLEDTAGKWRSRPTPQTPVEDLVRERTSPAVKAALASLRDAPTAQGTSKPARRKGAR